MKGLTIVSSPDDTKHMLAVIESWIIRLSPFAIAPGTIQDLVIALRSVKKHILDLSEENNEVVEKDAEIEHLHKEIEKLKAQVKELLGDEES